MRSPPPLTLRRGLLALNLAACGASSSGATGPISEADAAREFAAAECLRARDRDCAVPDACEAEVERQFAAAQARAVDQGRAYDPDCLQEHIDILTSDTFFSESDRCAVYPGPGGAGEPCQQEGPFGAFSSCAADLTCLRATGVCVAKNCPAYKSAQVGEACLGADGCLLARCDDPALDPTFCDVTAAEPVCAVMAKPGEPCGADLGCAEEGACHDGTCGPRRAAGEPCERGTQCEGLVCVAGACELASDPTGCTK